jgi:hypothetical protein
MPAIAVPASSSSPLVTVYSLVLALSRCPSPTVNVTIACAASVWCAPLSFSLVTGTTCKCRLR